MTARDKANELYSKYDDLLNKDFGNPIVFDNQLKQCALIAVDECINILNEICESSGYDPFESPLYDLKYWKEVKQEIEKL